MRWGELTGGKREAPEPLEGNVRAVVAGITAIWAVAFLVQLPFYGRYADAGNTEWLWACLAGVGLGFLGLRYVSRRFPPEPAGATDAPGAPDAPDTPGTSTGPSGTPEAPEGSRSR